jgi:hypothetical protein
METNYVKQTRNEILEEVSKILGEEKRRKDILEVAEELMDVLIEMEQAEYDLRETGTETDDELKEKLFKKHKLDRKLEKLNYKFWTIKV